MLNTVSQFPSSKPEEPNCEYTLSTVRGLTQADCSEQVRRLFVESLSKLTAISSVRFLTPSGGNKLNQSLIAQVKYIDRQPRLNWDAKPRRGIPASGALGRAHDLRIFQRDRSSPHVEVFPISVNGKLKELIEITRSMQPQDNDLELQDLIGIYQNFLRILNAQEHDALTGVYNRGVFDAHLALLAQSLRGETAQLGLNSEKWWLMMLDVDHFKQVNDGYGHLIGDEVLLLVARHIQNSLRNVDKIYRYGGEEFAVLLSPCLQTDAYRLAESIRHGIESAHFPQVENITISIGIAPIDHFDHVANIVGRADQALYQAKREGRNRVCGFAGTKRPYPRPGLQEPGALELFS